MIANKLPLSFYLNPNVVEVAQLLLGKYLCTNIDNKFTVGKIVETEAYCGATDKACHAHFGRTKRNKIMFAQGGVAYVYLCYGIHHLFNIVTNTEGLADAVLIRAVEPVEGIDTMLERRKMPKLAHRIAAGPGTVSKALGINTSFYGTDLQEDTIWIADNEHIMPENVVASPRIGVAYAEEDALLPWRFRIKANPWAGK
jgi:DNA-3-methyladenine glycosylase